jgi:selenocysteine lyase/cysteine desulfurase
VGRPRIEARLRELQTYARLRLQSIEGLQLLTPVQPGMWLQILSARSARRNAKDLADWLRNNDKVIVSHANATQDGMNVLRVSLHVYNSHDEIERLTQGLQRALRA